MEGSFRQSSADSVEPKITPRLAQNSLIIIIIIKGQPIDHHSIK